MNSCICNINIIDITASWKRKEKIYIGVTFLWVCAKLLQSCPTLWDPVDCSPPGSSDHEILQERILEWVSMPSSRGSSQPRYGTLYLLISPALASKFLTREALSVQLSSIQSLSSVQRFVTPWTAACQASLSIINTWSPPKPMSIKSVMISSHLILCRPLLLLPPVPPSIRVFSNESTLRMMWPKYWSFSFNISPSNEHSGLISFRMDWLDLLAVQGTLKILLQHHSSKAFILWRSAFFSVQLSHPYI